MTILGIDLGSARCGVCAIDGVTIVGTATVPVDAKDLKPAVARIVAAIESSAASRVAIEWSARPYTPRDATPQAMASIAYARETMAVLRDRIVQACEARAIPVTDVACATWRARIGVSRKRVAGVAGMRQAAWARLNPRRDTADRRVRNALDRLLGREALELTDVHQRDACGAALGVDPLPEARGPRHRPRTSRRGTGATATAVLSRVDQCVEAIRAHGRPIRRDVLAVRLAITPHECNYILRRAADRVVRVSPGVYALAPD